MRKYLYTLFSAILVSFLVLTPCDTAWTWSTHSEIVKTIYYSFPTNIQKNLDLDAMIDGSNDPDEKFNDFINHYYPKSYSLAKKWLDKGKSAYKNKKYYYASYCFGVASHYISDTFSAPHSANDTSTLHSKYENQATYLKPYISYSNKNLYTSIKLGDEQGEKDWNNWKKTKNPNIVQKDLNTATSTAYSAIKNCLY